MNPTRTGEEWRPIPNLPGYSVSNYGRICGPKGLRKLSKDKDGYLRFSIHKAGKHLKVKVHQAVLLAFVGPRPQGQVSRHLDGNQANNVLKNLAYGTTTENRADCQRHGTMYRGERHHSAKLTLAEVKAIRASNRSCKEEALRYNVDKSTIEYIRNGKTWRHAL